MSFLKLLVLTIITSFLVVLTGIGLYNIYLLLGLSDDTASLMTFVSVFASLMIAGIIKIVGE